MKDSIRLKITFLITFSLVFSIALCWILNKSFLGEFYRYNKIKSLETTYNEINDLLSNLDGDSNLSQETAQIIDKIASNTGVSAYIFTNTSVSIVSIYEFNGSQRQWDRIMSAREAYMSGNSPNLKIGKIDVIKSVENKYDICMLNDKMLQSDYLDLYGFTDSQQMIFLRTDYKSLQESIDFSNNFLAIIGVLVTIIGSAIMFFISRSFTRPILAMEGIAKKMCNLDFDAKYEVKTNDELGRLGTSINTLSDRLQSTISELKNANNELQSDNERKTQIDEMRKEFLSNVTHELKTPIALIQGYAEGLKENITEDQESRDFYCEVIIDEAQKMNKMVKKLLTLNQIEFGTNVIDIERFDLVTLIRSVLNATDILIKQKEIMIHFEETESCYVWADEYMIEEVVTNYISNAINHCDGANIIEIKLLKHNDTVRVAVFNTGELIPEDEIDKVWIKFYKVDKARTREYGGSGIGLSIVKAIMNSHNKECGAVNHTNGVEFWFELDATNDVDRSADNEMNHMGTEKLPENK